MLGYDEAKTRALRTPIDMFPVWLEVSAEHTGEYAPGARTYVYLVRLMDFVKIGFTRRGRLRIEHLESLLPVELEVVALLRGGPKLEAALHRKFASLRVRGEWFSYGPELREFVAWTQTLPREHSS